MKKDLLIIGGSYAGVQAAISARTHGYEGRITMVSADNELPYHRPPLSKGFLLGTTPPESLALRSEAFYTDQQIEVITNTTISAIDPYQGRAYVSQSPSVSKNKPFCFDHLVLATGASNVRLPWQEQAASGVFSLRTLEDAKNIKEAYSFAKKAVVVGGGFIGLELAAVFSQNNIETTLIERSSRLAERVLSVFLSSHIQKKHEDQGVTVRCESEVARLRIQNAAVTGVILTTGEVIDADLVVVGVGALPNSALLPQENIATYAGIAVDNTGRTAIPNVFAAGDCAAMNVEVDSSHTRRMRLESVHAANEMGKAAGAAVAGTTQPFVSAPWFWSDQYDLKLQMVGVPLPTDKTVVRGDVMANKFSVFHLRTSGEIGAVQSINRPAEHMLSRRLVKARIVAEPEQLIDDSINLKEWLATTQNTQE